MGHKKKKPFFRWLASATFPLLINICIDCPTSLFVCKKCVNICEVDVLGLGFKVSSKLGGYIFWFYIDFSFLCCCNDSLGTYKIVILCNIWCWAPVVLGCELGQVKNFFFCPFFGDQMQETVHLFNYNYINYKVFASCARFEAFHANSISGDFSW